MTPSTPSSVSELMSEVKARLRKLAEYKEPENAQFLHEHFLLAFETAHVRLAPLIAALIESAEGHEYSMRQWEAVSPDGYKHLVAWQRSRDCVARLEKLCSEIE